MGVAVKAVKASLASSLGVSHLPGSEFDRGICGCFLWLRFGGLMLTHFGENHTKLQ